MIAQQIGGKAVRDALFLSSHPVRDLPRVVLVSAAVSLVAVLAMTRLLSRIGPARIIPLAFAFSAVLSFAEWALLPSAQGAIATLVYLHIAALGGVTVSGFWSVVNERFDPHTAKQLIGRINAGGALGGLMGGLLVQQCSARLELRTMLLGLAIASLVGALCVSAVGGATRRPLEQVLGPLASLRLLKEMPYLRLLAALIALTGAAAALCDFAFKATVAAHLAHGQAMAGFFALFYGVASLSTLIVQAGFAKRALAKLGLAGTIATLPGGFLLVGLVGATLTNLVTVVVLRGVELTLSHSLFRSAYELFYTPLRPEKKRATKAIIDVAFDRVGDAMASAAVMVVLLVLPGRAASIAITVAVVASALALWVSFRLQAGYVATLGQELETKAIVLSPQDAVDATTRSTLAGSLAALDRQTLLEGIERLRQARASSPLPPRLPAGRKVVGELPSEIAPLLARIGDLFSDSVERSRRALALPLDPRLVPFVLSLVAKTELRRDALGALQRVHRRAAGQIADALLDHGTPAIVRFYLPELLALAGDQRAADALVDGLGDERLDVRTRCARGLAQMREQTPDLYLSRARLVEMAERELAGLALARVPGDLILTHVFDVLALAFEEKGLCLAWRALRSGDARLHGTALEYLENVLPGTLCGILWPYLDDHRAERAAPRARDLIDAGLRASMGSGSAARANGGVVSGSH